MNDLALSARHPTRMVASDRAARAAASTLAIYRQLDQSQWAPDQKLRDGQFWQVSILLAHAWRTIPFYRERLARAGLHEGQKIGPQDWRKIPILTRREVQEAGDRLKSLAIPKAHGEILCNTTSGSTGTPVTVHGTIADACFFKAFGLRSYLWHGFDFSARLAYVRKLKTGVARAPAGIEMARWGETGGFPFPTGPAAALNISASIDQQIDWLQRVKPDYLVTYPTNLLALIERCEDRGARLDRLAAVLTTGEVLTQEARDRCRDALGATIVDIYSAQETGGIALQCPDHEHYHLHAEAAIVEVLDEDGRPCAPGAVGRVVVTPLHNFAMPLIRYEIGDYAEVGEACECGRGLPVLNRIMGRTRNMLITPSGEKYFPFFGTTRFAEIAPVVQHRFVQKSRDMIEVQLVTRRRLSDGEEDRLRARILDRLPCPIALRFVYLEAIPRSASGKFEDFICEVAG